MESLNVNAHIILPLLIFIAKIMDVAMGTVRIILISKNRRRTASLLSFFEILIWLMAISNIMKNLDNMICCIAYALGYSSGVYIGMMIEQSISKDNVTSGLVGVTAFFRLFAKRFLIHTAPLHRKF